MSAIMYSDLFDDDLDAVAAALDRAAGEVGARRLRDGIEDT
ncbi:hypothetical protein [Microbacterium lacticum]